MMKYEAGTLLLWLIAILTTLFVTRDTGQFSILGPVFAFCLIGCVLIVRKARAARPRGNASIKDSARRS
jgi:hypothetical protein